MKPDFKKSSPTPPFFPGSTSLQFSLPPPPLERHRRMGNGGYGQLITCCLCCSYLLRGKTPHTLTLLQREIPLTGDSSPQTSPT